MRGRESVSNRQVQNLSPPGLNFAQAKGLKFCTGGAYILHDPTVTIYIGLFRATSDFIYTNSRKVSFKVSYGEARRQ